MQTRCGCGETTQLAHGFGELDERVESMQQPLSTEPLRGAVSDRLLGNETVSPAPRSSQPKA